MQMKGRFDVPAPARCFELLLASARLIATFGGARVMRSSSEEVVLPGAGQPAIGRCGTSYAPVVFTNILAAPLTALIAVNAAFVLAENGGYPDARNGQDDTNLRICFVLFVFVVVPFLTATFIVLLKQKQLSRVSAWSAGLATLVLPPLCLFLVLVSTGSSFG